MTNVRSLARRRLDKRPYYASRRETEVQFFERVRRQMRRAELRLGRREIQWSFGALAAQGAMSITFPPAPVPRDWEELDDLVARITPENSHPPLLDDEPRTKTCFEG